jgi:hypothetical protein
MLWNRPAVPKEKIPCCDRIMSSNVVSPRPTRRVRHTQHHIAMVSSSVNPGQCVPRRWNPEPIRSRCTVDHGYPTKALVKFDAVTVHITSCTCRSPSLAAGAKRFSKPTDADAAYRGANVPIVGPGVVAKTPSRTQGRYRRLRKPDCGTCSPPDGAVWFGQITSGVDDANTADKPVPGGVSGWCR